MPSSVVRINSSSHTDCVKTKHKESLRLMKSLLSSINKFEATPPNQEIYTLLVKKFIFSVATIQDDYFLSDVCELTHDLFVEFRFALGYFEGGKAKKVAGSMVDTTEMCTEIYDKFRDFLSDPGYSGTNFPKPSKLKAMGVLAGLVADKEDIFVLRKADLKKTGKLIGAEKKKNRHVAIDMNFLQDIQPSVTSTDSITEPVTSADSSTLETPLAPQLSNEEIGAMKIALGNRKGSMFVAAIGDLMPPPPPPISSHGRIRYVEVDENAPTPPPSRRASNPYTSSQLRPPILVDDDGDVLPNGAVPNFPLQPQLKSAAASIYESSDGRIIVDEHASYANATPKQSRVLDDDDSFIQAYREYAMESGKTSSGVENGGKSTSSEKKEFGSSGWSLQNRA